ncbi:MAG TPA: hypothetical protein PKH16_14800 [Aequorivita sp.]|jgi:hypothetical protein|nr:hypothetical protein [Aequorivita sp.]MBP41829.1 hypothetical protein [Aequorivita sp.]HBC05359.1 hypothetical protein [Aequorivita sp.]HNP69174.1 hypothetical protein [Aequorivita sp.]|tara:strand:- start:9016 stop:9534 length:519 start_codon:yes stop_codon:yes gene_type:complete
MLKKVKHHSLKKHTEKNLTERDISERNTSLKYLGFLVDEAFFDDFEMLYGFGKELGLQRKDVKLFTFVETRRKIPSLRQNQITNKEFTWRGEIHNQNAQEFLDFPFDVLIGFYKGKHEFLGAMVAQSKAKFKIGFNGADERLFDLLLAVDLQKPEAFKSEVKKYLKILNKIE